MSEIYLCDKNTAIKELLDNGNVIQLVEVGSYAVPIVQTRLDSVMKHSVRSIPITILAKSERTEEYLDSSLAEYDTTYKMGNTFMFFHKERNLYKLYRWMESQRKTL